MSDLLNAVIGGLREGSLYGLLALGIVLVYKATGVLNFALGNIGMVATLVLMSLTGSSLPYWVDLALSLAFAAVLGLVVERVLVRPALHAPATSVMIVTLAISTLLGAIAFQIWANTTASTLIPPFDTTSRELGHSGVFLAPLDVATWLIGVALAAGLYLFFRCTRLGIAMRATADRPLTVGLLGVRAGTIAALAWAMGSVLAAICAILIAANLPGLGVTFMLEPLIWAVLAAALGSMTSLPGALIAALLIGVADQVLQVPFGSLDLSTYHRAIL
ncbi:MAG TPA: branched-chain amino acid ABC transporter permease, partial [Chloroflexota bacterium]|nr:branched-chain amino acid ABC transporter permease [Chloroflexota bacterium]